MITIQSSCNGCKPTRTVHCSEKSQNHHGGLVMEQSTVAFKFATAPICSRSESVLAHFNSHRFPQACRGCSSRSRSRAHGLRPYAGSLPVSLVTCLSSRIVTTTWAVPPMSIKPEAGLARPYVRGARTDPTWSSAGLRVRLHRAMRDSDPVAVCAGLMSIRVHGPVSESPLIPLTHDAQCA